MTTPVDRGEEALATMVVTGQQRQLRCTADPRRAQGGGGG